ncbi:alpha-xenorhabdolysin family binary toxin subunit A [Pseudomonas sp. MAFF212428]|uniref:Alpha-xenorhabdolysin family binary toxin subunit A n=1 Tax=Pseudomonas brassicae TaxID=2708063 RepID=A0A6M0CT30_9PSED|nr:alpha-xenorhabdolysin family binary toxin subunit A [Pseudomonas brassicae]
MESLNEEQMDALQEQVAALPLALIQALNNRDVEDEGGLTLSRENIKTLNRYSNFVVSLPDEADKVERWLGFDSGDDPLLSAQSIADLHLRLQAHGKSWGGLSDSCKKLSVSLATCANKINTTGQTVIKYCHETEVALGKHRRWDDLEFLDPIALTDGDRGIVNSLVEYMQVLRVDANSFAKRVTRVRAQAEAFRDEARWSLAPDVSEMKTAALREGDGHSASEIREELDKVDGLIAELRREYDEYVKSSLYGLAGGLIGVTITASIYAPKAEATRKERNRKLERRDQLSEQLVDAQAYEGHMQRLISNLDILDSRVQDVTVAAAHLQSAWQSVETYIDASIEDLESISTGQQLARFVLFFQRFLGQWSVIESNAQVMNKMFDDAVSER